MYLMLTLLFLLGISTFSTGLPAKLRRSKRGILRDEHYRWPKAVIPYILDDVFNTDQKLISIKRSMATFERLTCLKFQPYSPGGQAETLGHNSWLTFINEEPCAADQGFKNWTLGQEITCCEDEVCMHELGHALGIVHTQQSPARDRWIRMNPDNVKPDKAYRYDRYDEDDVIDYEFDIQSVMAYHKTLDSISPGLEVYTMLYPEMENGINFYYLLKEVSDMYGCADRCPDFPMDCEHDGYLTQVNGECVCICPPGLDPATGCTTILTQSPVTEYPGGQWALPMPESGCPNEAFKEGYRSPVSDPERGPHQKSTPYSLRGTVERSTLEQYYCVNDGAAGSDDVYWGDGNFCVLRKGGKCPDIAPNAVPGSGFHEGRLFLNFWQRKDTDGEQTGEMPDGTFTERDAEYHYCCRYSGFADLPMYLPNTKPLALPVPRFPVDQCPQVFGMHAVEEMVGIAGLNDYEYNYPTPYYNAERQEDDAMMKRFYIKHCYYTPAVTDCGDVIHLDEDNPSAIIESEPGANLDCQWLITSPENSRIEIDITEIDIISYPDGCDDYDYLDIRYFRLGQKGVKVCNPESVMSISNEAMLQFVTTESDQYYFKAHIKVVFDSDLCYNAEDKGYSYAGNVNYTRTFTPCLHWTETINCRHSAFDIDAIGEDLSGNNCRNPGNGERPWCYTDLENCARDYCDVCQFERQVDKPYFPCEQFKTDGKCTSEPATAIYECPETCKEEINFPAKPPKADEVRCPYPPPLPESTMNTTMEEGSEYFVGERVTYTCNPETGKSGTVVRTCQSTGTWSPANYVCFECDMGWKGLNGKCYKFFPVAVKGYDAIAACDEIGAELAQPKDQATNELLLTLRPTDDLQLWLGAKNKGGWNKFLWLDGTKLERNDNWDSTVTKKMGRWGLCPLLLPNGKWFINYCNTNNIPHPYVCQKGGEATKRSAGMTPQVCADFSPDCDELITAQPNMCSNEFSEFSGRMCYKTCGLCDSSEADECALPDPPQHAEFVHKSNYQRTMAAEGTEVHYRCKEGAILESGDAIRVCNQRAFTGTPIVCISKCPLPTLSENVEFVDASNAQMAAVSDGVEVVFRCKEGTERASGDLVRTCVDGALSGEELTCKVQGVTEEVETCFDVAKKGKCAEYSIWEGRKNYCNRAWAKLNCRRFCWICQPIKPDICEDTHKGCPMFADRYGGVNQYCLKTWPKRNCEKTCGQCGPMIEDATSPKIATIAKPDDDACVDGHTGCPGFAERQGGAAVYCKRPWPQRHCKKTCGICQPTVKASKRGEPKME